MSVGNTSFSNAMLLMRKPMKNEMKVRVASRQRYDGFALTIIGGHRDWRVPSPWPP